MKKKKKHRGLLSCSIPRRIQTHNSERILNLTIRLPNRAESQQREDDKMQETDYFVDLLNQHGKNE